MNIIDSHDLHPHHQRSKLVPLPPRPSAPHCSLPTPWMRQLSRLRVHEPGCRIAAQTNSRARPVDGSLRLARSIPLPSCRVRNPQSQSHRAAASSNCRLWNNARPAGKPKSQAYRTDQTSFLVTNVAMRSVSPVRFEDTISTDDRARRTRRPEGSMTEVANARQSSHRTRCTGHGIMKHHQGLK
jgi:hypothetical protein